MVQTNPHLKVLGLDCCESLPDLKKAYRREMHLWHPDRHQGDPAMVQTATKRAQDINAAFEHLCKMVEAGSPNRGAGKPRRTKMRKPDDDPAFVPGFPNPAVAEIFVQSSNIRSVGYDPGDQVLYVKYRDHALYGYLDVPEDVFTGLMQAESHGRFAYWQICYCYRSQRIR